MRIPKSLRDKVIAREDHCCIRCGQWAEGGSLHHRVMRSQGGRNTIENLVLVCGSGITGCHGWAHHNRTDALAERLLVRSFDDPATTPVRVYGHGWVLLTAAGTYQPSTAPTEPLGGAA